MSEDLVVLAKGDRLHEVMRIWEKGLSMAVNGYLGMGQAIHLLKQEKLWRLTAQQMQTFNHWVKVELKISPAQAHRLEQIYREVGPLLEGMSTPVDISKVTLLLPHLDGKTEEQKLDMLHMAAECTVEGLKDNLKDIAGNGDQATDVCQHYSEWLEEVTRCRRCGKWLK